MKRRVCFGIFGILMIFVLSGCGVKLIRESSLINLRAEAQAARSEAETAKVEAEVAKAEAQAARSEAETAKVEAEVAKAEAEVAKAEAEVAKAENILSARENRRLHAQLQIEKIRKRQEQMIVETAKIARKEAEENPWTEEKVLGILMECEFEKSNTPWPVWLKSWEARYRIWDIKIWDYWTISKTEGKKWYRCVWIYPYPKGDSTFLWTKQVPQPFEDWGPEWARIYDALPK